ncbi:MAG: CoA-binding protein [Chloroflexota bacterium]
MVQLGTLTAGVAHELNNPAAAARRSASQISEAATTLEAASQTLIDYGLTAEQYAFLREFATRHMARAAQVQQLDALVRSDREYEIESWCDEMGIDNGWELAPALVEMGCDRGSLDELAETFEQSQLEAVVAWLAASSRLQNLGAEIAEATTRISTIIKSLKDYSYLDQAPLQAVNIHEGIDNTLTMLHHRLKNNVTIVREYADDLPIIQAYGSELNQVWTNLISNALDAMEEQGEITISTQRRGEWVQVEIGDTGPGIPEDVQERIFDAFFTTKPPGKGTGLGLNISYNIIVYQHMGEIHVASRPGQTVFRILLPLDVTAARARESAIETYEQPDDDLLMTILKSARRIAVVGMSANPDRPSNVIPRYLEGHGYEIIPVNPVLVGEPAWTAYPDLSGVPGHVDVVLVFRRSEAVASITEEAIAIGADTLWMQEGIVNLDAAILARSAGLNVVMNSCMRNAHQRLMPG